MFWQQGGRKIFCQSTSRTCESNSSVRIGTPIGQDITRRIIFLLELSVDDDRIIFVSSLEKGLVVVRYQLHRELELLQLDLGTAVVPRPDGLSTVTLTTSPMRLQVQQFLQIKQQYIHAFFKIMCLAFARSLIVFKLKHKTSTAKLVPRRSP